MTELDSDVSKNTAAPETTPSSTGTANKRQPSVSKRHPSKHRPSHRGKPRARKASMTGALVGGLNFGLGGAVAGAAIGHTLGRVVEAHQQRSDKERTASDSSGAVDVKQRTCVIV